MSINAWTSEEMLYHFQTATFIDIKNQQATMIDRTEIIELYQITIIIKSRSVSWHPIQLLMCAMEPWKKDSIHMPYVKKAGKGHIPIFQSAEENGKIMRGSLIALISIRNSMRSWNLRINRNYAIKMLFSSPTVLHLILPDDEIENNFKCRCSEAGTSSEVKSGALRKIITGSLKKQVFHILKGSIVPRISIVLLW